MLEAEGADGNTLKQLQDVLRLPEDLTNLRLAYKHIQKALIVNTSTVELSVNQVLFSDQNRPVDIDFAFKLDNVYEADHLPVNFHNTPETFNKINDYINEQSHGKIRRIVNMDDLKDAQMVLISAIFFKGQWKVCCFFFKVKILIVHTYLESKSQFRVLYLIFYCPDMPFYSQF